MRISLPQKVLIKEQFFNFFCCLLFFYFLTLSADRLNIQVGLFKFKINNLLSVGLFLFLLFSKRIIFFFRSNFALFAFLFSSMLISTFLGVHKFRSSGYLLAFIFEFLFYFLLAFNLMYQFDRKKILAIYFFSFKCLGMHAIFQLVLSFFGVRDPFIGQWIVEGVARPNAFAYEPSYYALCMTSFVMFYNVLFLLKDKHEKSSFTELVLVNIFLLVSTSTAGFFAYFILFCICIVSHWLGYMKNYGRQLKAQLIKTMVVFSTFIFFVGLFAFELLRSHYLKFFYQGLTHHSFATRWIGIKEAWNTFLDHPFFGVGLGGVGPYIYEKKFQMSSESLTLGQIEHYDPTNVFTEVLASLGIVGMIGFLSLAYWVFKMFKKATDLPGASEQDHKIAIALFISLVVLMVELQFNQGVFRNYIWVHTGIVCGFYASVLKEQASRVASKL